jgi:hypothetical protein
MSVLRVCLDRRVLLALAAIAGLISILAPELVLTALPLLIVAACPLSMIVVMAMMRHGGAGHGETRGRGATDVRHELAELANRRASLESELAGLETVESRPPDGLPTSVGR